MDKVVINIAEDFSKYPSGRFITDGRYSGQLFREKYLEKELKAGKSIEVILDGVKGYPSSFTEEAFGGLVRLGYDKETLRAKIEITYSAPAYKSYAEDIESAISEAVAP